MANAISTSDTSILRPSDEIDMLALLRSIGRTWKHLFIALVLVSATYVGYLSLKILSDNPNTNAYKTIKLTFIGVDKGTYPNGAPFQLEDIIAPVIVQDVFERHNLGDFSMTVEEFRRTLSVEPYAPTYSIIVDRYKQLLSNTKLTVPEVAAIEKSMSAELTAATNGAVILTIHLGRFALPLELVSKVLSDLPATWAQYSISSKGVLNLDIELASAKSIDRELVDKVDYIVISDLLQEKTELVEDNITRLSEFDGAATLQDPQTGLKLADLKQSLDDLKRYVIDDLMSPIRSLGLTRNRHLSLYYYEDKRYRLNEQIQLLQKQAALVKEAFDKYSYKDSGTSIRSSQEGAYLGGGTQLSAGALDKVLDMSSEGKVEEYRQTLNRQWLDLNIQATEIQNQTDEVSRLIQALKGEGQSEISKVLRDEYLARAESTLPKILDKISAYLDITQRIYKQLSQESVGVNGRLYQPITNQPYTKAFPIDIKRAILVWVALVFITIIIVVPAVMVYNTMKSDR